MGGKGSSHGPGQDLSDPFRHVENNSTTGKASKLTGNRLVKGDWGDPSMLRLGPVHFLGR